MAYAFDDKNKPVAVASLEDENVFTGPVEFTAAVASSSVTTGTVVINGGLGVQGSIYGSKVWGSMWNDLADCIEVPEDTLLEPGYCYCFDGKNYYKSTKYLDDGIIGLQSDTAGFYMGNKKNKHQMKVAVSGFVLAHLDRVYKSGTPLTCGENGILIEMKEEDLIKYPHKVVATFWKEEKAKTWGTEKDQIEVNNRHWVKVR